VIGKVGQLDPGPVVALLDSKRGDGIGEVTRRHAGDRVVVVAVPRAPEQALLDGPLTQRAALVRAAVLQSAETPATARQGHRTTIDDGSANPALVGNICLLEAVPGGPGHGLLPNWVPFTHCRQRAIAEGSPTAVI